MRPRHTGAWSPHGPDQAQAPAPPAAHAALGMRAGVLPEAAQKASRAAAGAKLPSGSESKPAPVRRGRGGEPGFASGSCSGHDDAMRTASAADETPAGKPALGLRYGLRCDVPGSRPMSAEAANAVSPPCSHPVPQEGGASAPASPARGVDSAKRPPAGSATPSREAHAAVPACRSGGAGGGRVSGAGGLKLGSGLVCDVPSPLLCTSPGRAAGAAAAHRATALKRLACGGRAAPKPAPAPCAGIGPAAITAPRAHEPGGPDSREAPSSVAIQRPHQAPALHTARPTVLATVAGGMPGHAAARAAARSQRTQASPEALGDPTAGPRAPPDARARDAGAPKGDKAQARTHLRAPDPSPSPTLTPPPPRSTVKRGLSRLLGLSPMRRGGDREQPSTCASVSQAGPLAKGARPGAGSPQGTRTAGPEAGPLATGRAGWAAGWQAAGMLREPGPSKGFAGMGGGRWRRRDDARADSRH